MVLNVFITLIMPAPLSLGGSSLLARLRSRERIRSRRSVSRPRQPNCHEQKRQQEVNLYDEAEKTLSEVLTVSCPLARPLPCRTKPTTAVERCNLGLDCDEVRKLMYS